MLKNYVMEISFWRICAKLKNYKTKSQTRFAGLFIEQCIVVMLTYNFTPSGICDDDKNKKNADKNNQRIFPSSSHKNRVRQHKKNEKT